jgi:hypothetical protein
MRAQSTKYTQPSLERLLLVEHQIAHFSSFCFHLVKVAVDEPDPEQIFSASSSPVDDPAEYNSNYVLYLLGL